MPSQTFYLTTAIDYVNSLPHLGTAYEKIGADVLARFLRMKGYRVYFQMGNDEHSTNVYKAALAKNLDPKTYCDQMLGLFTAVWKQLHISYDGFIQTSEERHHLAVEKMFQAIEASGDLYEGNYEGWYCESCEAFYTEKDLQEGLCPNHKQKPKWILEKNYFFRLSRYQKPLLDYFEAHPDFIVPEIRKNEILSLIRQGLEDISVSRMGGKWGVKVPGHPEQVIYVWFDALINYLTAIGYGSNAAEHLKTFEEFWPANLHVIGKDITRFHAVIWPAMLLSAGLPLPKHIFGHGFVYLKGEKMSKTLGNVVTPLDILKHFSADVLRYYLLRGSSFGADGNFTWEEFETRYNSDLANDLGNLLNRTLGMIQKYSAGILTKGNLETSDSEIIARSKTAEKQIEAAFDFKRGDLEFHLALGCIWDLIGLCDQFIDREAPWKLKKENQTDRLNQVLYHLVDTLRWIGLWLEPFLPETSEKIYAQLGLSLPDQFSKSDWGQIPNGHKVGAASVLFPRIEKRPDGEDQKDR